MENCVFCGIITGSMPATVVYEDDYCVAFMDIFPLRPGHLLVVPKAHHELLTDLPDSLRDGMLWAGVRIAAALKASDLPCDGINYVINDGRAAQQTVPHVHLHVLPRRRGDFWRFLGTIARRLIPGLHKPATRDRLAQQAEAIRAHLRV